MTYSALFSSSLNKLIPQGTDAEFIHQGPIRKTAYAHGNPEVADIIGCQHDSGRYVFVSDLKRNDLELAEKETALYAKHASLNKTRDPNSCFMILGLAGTTHVAGVRLYLMAEKKIWALPIFDDVRVPLIYVWEYPIECGYLYLHVCIRLVETLISLAALFYFHLKIMKTAFEMLSGQLSAHKLHLLHVQLNETCSLIFGMHVCPPNKSLPQLEKWFDICLQCNLLRGNPLWASGLNDHLVFQLGAAQ